MTETVIVLGALVMVAIILLTIWWLDRKQHAATTREISALIEYNRTKLFERLEAERARVRGGSRE